MKSILVVLLLLGCSSGPHTEENYFKHTRPALKECNGPFGPIPHGGILTAYESLLATGSDKCKSEVRTCTDGILSGTYYFPGCTEVAQAGQANPVKF